jgi:2'-hydroxyisoflavone reductase
LGLTPWTEGTLWIPETDESSRGFFAFDCRKAINDGLTFRALDGTVKATLEWDRTRPVDRKWKAGITKEREEELLRKVVEMAVED